MTNRWNCQASAFLPESSVMNVVIGDREARLGRYAITSSVMRAVFIRPSLQTRIRRQRDCAIGQRGAMYSGTGNEQPAGMRLLFQRCAKVAPK